MYVCRTQREKKRCVLGRDSQNFPFLPEAAEAAAVAAQAAVTTATVRSHLIYSWVVGGQKKENLDVPIHFCQAEVTERKKQSLKKEAKN